VIGPWQRTLPGNKQQSKERVFHASDGIRTPNPIKPALYRAATGIGTNGIQDIFKNYKQFFIAQQPKYNY